MIWRSFKNKVFAQIADFLTVLFSFLIGYLFWSVLQNKYPRLFGNRVEVQYFEILIAILSSAVWVILLNYHSAYSYQRFTSLATEFNKVIKASIFVILTTIALIFIFRIDYISRTLVIIIFTITIIAIVIEKIVMFHVAKIIRKKGKDRKRLLIVGTGKQASGFIETIRNNFGWGLDIIGIVSNDSEKVNEIYYGYKVISTIDGLRHYLHTNVVDEVIVTISTKWFNRIKKVIAIGEEEGVQVRIISDFFGSLNKRLKIDHVYGLPIISILQVPEDGFALLVKKILDIIISSILLLCLSPVMLVISLLIKVTSKGPVLYEWNVVGLNKKPFKSWKFRTMSTDADELKSKLLEENEMNGPVFKIKDDPRVTPVGRFLRKYSLDELPQLVSVLKGDMSLVGPRPAFPNEVARYANWQRRKLSIKPGITCLWQVSGRNEINDFNEWAKMDLYYIDNWSIWLDLKILFKTIPAVLTSKGAS